MNCQARLDSRHHHGFTLIELLLVISIVAIIGSSSTPFLSRFVLQVNFDMAVDKIVSSVRKAQEYSMDGKNNETWGVCTSGNKLRLFSGSCSQGILESFTIPNTVTISGLESVVFSKRGEPMSPVSIVVSTSIEAKTILLNAAGGLEIN